MQRLEVSGAVRPIYGSLGVKRLMGHVLATRLIVFGATAPPPNWGQALLIHEVSRSHTTTHNSR